MALVPGARNEGRLAFVTQEGGGLAGQQGGIPNASNH